MSKKINITDKIETVTYKGCVTIEYFDIVKGKKIINAYNAGTENLFDSLAKAMRGDSFIIPDSIMLYKGNSESDKILATPAPYTTSPLLYKAELQVDDTYKYTTVNDNDQLANCVGYTFIVPKGSFTNIITGTKVTRLALVKKVNDIDKIFATLALDPEKQFEADNSSNIQIMWKLIFK